MAGDWEIYASDSGASCGAIAIFDDDETDKPVALVIGFDAADQRVDLYFSNWTATSVDDDTTVDLDIVFLSNRDVDDGWRDIEFRVAHADDGSVSFFSNNLNKQMLIDFAKHETILFRTQNEVSVEVFPLDGTAAAIKLLRECAFTIAGLNPKDPFLQ